MARRGARAVEWDGLENRCALPGTEGSNPSLSAMLVPETAILVMDSGFRRFGGNSIFPTAPEKALIFRPFLPNISPGSEGVLRGLTEEANYDQEDPAQEQR